MDKICLQAVAEDGEATAWRRETPVDAAHKSTIRQREQIGVKRQESGAVPRLTLPGIATLESHDEHCKSRQGVLALSACEC